MAQLGKGYSTCEKGVIFNLLTKKDNSISGNGIIRVSGNFPVLLFFTVHNGSDGVALHAYSEAVPSEKVSNFLYVIGMSI